MSPAPQIMPSMIKFGRAFELGVVSNTSPWPATPANWLYFTFPLTLDFSVTHHVFAEANSANFTIHNLSKTHRNQVFVNQFTKAHPFPVQLRAGYLSTLPGGYNGSPSSLPVIFNGYQVVSYTERNGAELETRINAVDFGDSVSGQPMGQLPGPPNLQYVAQPGQPFEKTVEDLTGFLDPTFGTVKFGGVYVDDAQIPADNPWYRPFVGSAWENLVALAGEVHGAHVFIENGSLYILGQNDTIPVAVTPVISNSTGLLGLPRYDGWNITCKMVFEPSIALGTQVILQSEFEPVNNSICKVISYTHSGTISGVESGDCTTELTLLYLGTKTGGNT